jgi:ribosomal-protein-alanine N-acetyltransferase
VAVEIRPFLRRHLDRVVEIERLCFAHDAYPADLFLDLYRENGELFFVARRSRRIVGYCVACVTGAEAEVVSVAVVPEHRGAGVGRALMRHTMTRLKRLRVRTLALMVRPENQDALRLYRRLGFRAVGRVPRYYEDHSDRSCLTYDEGRCRGPCYSRLLR